MADQVAIIQNGKIILNDYLEKVKSTLLGFPVFDATFADDIQSFIPEIQRGVKVINRNENQISFEVEDPQVSNPALIQYLSRDFRLVSFQQKSRKLETAYLEAVNHLGGK